MSFRIEVEQYRALGARDPEDTTTTEAIESVYSGGPEVRLIMGPQAWVRLPMSGGISDIYKSIVRMLEYIEAGVYPFEISFLSSSFTAKWLISESSGILTIKTVWIVVDGYFNGRRIRDARFSDAVSRIVVEKAAFVAEWQNLAKRVKGDLLSAGYGDDLGGFEYLRTLK